MLQQKCRLWTLKKMDSKSQSGLHRPRSLSVPLTAFVVDNQMVLHSRKMYTCHSGLCAIRCLTGLQWQPGIFLMQLLQLLLATSSQDFNLTQRANLGLRGILCFCIFYEKCTVNFVLYSLVLIIFSWGPFGLRVLSLPASVCVCVSLCVSTFACPRDNSSPVQARVT